MPVVTSEERLGTTLDGKYRLDRILGEGGMGVVFAGEHVRLHKPVAVKFLHPQFSQAGEVVHRFIREAQSAARLSHPNVVDVRDVDTAPDGAVYMVLELLEGESLASHLARVGKLSVHTALAFVEPAMDALAVAHAAGIVHRDIKPDNIHLSRSLSGDIVPKVLDFGIAKLAESASGSATATGSVIGTPAYMAPEQALGRKDLGPPADVWSMAVVLYECLSGVMPFDFPTDTNPMGIVVTVLTDTPISLGTRCPELPAALVRVIDRALQKDAAQRYPTMREFLQALRATHEGTLAAGSQPVPDAALARAASLAPAPGGPDAAAAPRPPAPAHDTGPLGDVMRPAHTGPLPEAERAAVGALASATPAPGSPHGVPTPPLPPTAFPVPTLSGADTAPSGRGTKVGIAVGLVAALALLGLGASFFLGGSPPAVAAPPAAPGPAAASVPPVATAPTTGPASVPAAPSVVAPALPAAPVAEAPVAEPPVVALPVAEPPVAGASGHAAAGHAAAGGHAGRTGAETRTETPAAPERAARAEPVAAPPARAEEPATTTRTAEPAAGAGSGSGHRSGGMSADDF
jgi:tRNA A-37 threonylcarbamoyl transferase component Bud32